MSSTDVFTGCQCCGSLVMYFSMAFQVGLYRKLPVAMRPVAHVGLLASV